VDADQLDADRPDDDGGDQPAHRGAERHAADGNPAYEIATARVRKAEPESGRLMHSAYRTTTT
jgi:hypothetical protein